MSIKRKSNLQVGLARRSQGVPALDCFDCRSVTIPNFGEGDSLLRTEYRPVASYMRGRMNEGQSHAEAVPLDKYVTANAEWHKRYVSEGTESLRVVPGINDSTLALDALGMPVFTAYIGSLEIVRPRFGGILIGSATAGDVGSIVVGQIGKLIDCRVVGVVEFNEKYRCTRQPLRLDTCVSHRAHVFPRHLNKVCQGGIEIYFKNFWGAVVNAVLPLFNIIAGVLVGGLTAPYSTGVNRPESIRMSASTTELVVRRMRFRDFIITFSTNLDTRSSAGRCSSGYASESAVPQ